MYSGINYTKTMSLPRTQLVRSVNESPMSPQDRERFDQRAFQRTEVDPTALYEEEWTDAIKLQDWRNLVLGGMEQNEAWRIVNEKEEATKKVTNPSE